MPADLIASVYEAMIANGPYHLADADEMFFRLEDVPAGYATVLLSCDEGDCGKCMSRDGLLKACPICGRDVCNLFESVCTCGTRMYTCQGYEDTMRITAIVLPTVTYELGKGEEDVV